MIIEYIVINNAVYAVHENGTEEFCAECPTAEGAEKLCAALNQRLIED